MSPAYFNFDSFHHDSLLNLKHVRTSRNNLLCELEIPLAYLQK